MSMKNDTIVIKNNKIYTSYFARASKIIPDRRLVSVALSTPDYWGGSFARQFNPSASLIHKIKNKEITPEEYEIYYKAEVLDKLDPVDEAVELYGKVLCCWEKPGNFCHRHIILKWLADAVGDSIIGEEI